MQHSYNSLYHIKYPKHILIIFLIIVLLVSLIVTFKTKAYSSYKTYGVYLNSQLYVDIPITNSDAVNKGEYIKIDNQKYDIVIREISGLQTQGNINYQTYSLKAFKEYKNNQIVEITFYYNKQRIITKIMDIIF